MSGAALITIEGFIGREPEMRYFESGSKITELSVAVSHGSGDNKHTDWFRVKIWGQNAEFVAEKFKKGDAIGVAGTFTQEQWTKQDGTAGNTLVVNAHHTWFPCRRTDGEAQQPQQQKTAQQNTRKPQAQQQKLKVEAPF